VPAETEITPGLPEVPAVDRWRRWLGLSLGIQLGTLFLYPALVCGCHFNPLAFLFSLMPVAWAGFTLLTYQAPGERILAYANLAVTFGWFHLEWVNNLQFLFR
jgi:hypothetical protein